MKNGPLRVDGNVAPCACAGRTIHRVTTTSLCRCVPSADQTRCDGTHAQDGFAAA